MHGSAPRQLSKIKLDCKRVATSKIPPCTHLGMLLRMSLTGKRWLLMAKGSGEFTEFKEFTEWRSRPAPDKARTLGIFGDSDLVGIGEMDWTGLERQGTVLM